MDAKEAIAQLEKLTRERAALEGSYTDLMVSMEGHKAPTDQHEREAELAGLIVRLVNYIEMEREQNAAMYELLKDAYAKLVEAYTD